MTLFRGFQIALASMMLSSVHAQAPYSMIHYPEDTVSHWYAGTHLVALPGGSAIAWVSAVETNVGSRVFVIGLNPDGSARWHHVFEGPADTTMTFNAVELLQDGTLAACGSFGTGGLYVRMDTLGTLLAARRITHIGSEQLFDLVQKPNGDLRVVGRMTGTGLPYTGLWMDIDLAGQVLDATQVRIDNMWSWSDRLVPTNDSGHVAIGSCWQTQPLIKSINVTKVDALGQVQWAKRLNTTGSGFFPIGITELAHGDVVLFAHVSLSGTFRPVLLTFSSTGDLIRSAEVNGGAAGLALQTARMQGDSMLVMGCYNSQGDHVVGMDTSFAIGSALRHEMGGTSARTMTLLGDGDVLFASNTVSPLSGHALEVDRISLDGIGPCGDTALVVTTGPVFVAEVVGHTQLPATMVSTDVSALLVSTSRIFHEMPGCLSTVVDDTPLTGTITLCPNPAQGMVRVSGMGIERVVVVDALGRVMFFRSYGPGGTVQFDISDLAMGLYHVRVRSIDRWSSIPLIKE